jgi:hypothetical protein
MIIKIINSIYSNFRISVFISIIVFSPVFLFAQFGTIKGFVYEKETGEPVIYTNVYLQNSTYGAATDVNGYFVISKIPAGSYTLLVTYLGFDTLKMEISIKSDEIISKQLYLVKGSYMLEQVQVTAEREEARTETRTSVVKITPKQIKQIPAVGGQPDLAQYLQVLPGVIFTGDQGGQLYIRGGSPIQNKVILDGMVIYNPFHSIGLFSVFDTDILRNADIYTGGFGAEYGGRISSVMDITTRDGNKTRFSGKAGASTFGANMMIEGPISKQKEGKGGSSSFILSAKNSYLEQSSKVFYEYIDEDGLPFNYTDIYGKVSILGNDGSKVNFFGFSFNDKVNDYKALTDYHWESYGGGSNFIIIPAQSSVLIEGHLAYSQYKVGLENKTSSPSSSSINSFNLGFDFTYFLGKNDLKWGVEAGTYATDYILYNSLFKNSPWKSEIGEKKSSTEIAGYFKYKLTTGKWLIEPSFRLHVYAELGISPEPRLALKYNASDKFRIKFAGGIYAQNIFAANSDKEVVNLFSGYISGPVDTPEMFFGKYIYDKSGLQKAGHVILGFEYDIIKYITINLEGYYKNFFMLTNLNRNKLFEGGANEFLWKDFMNEKGYATGIDLTLKYDYKRFYFWLVYSLGYVTRKYEEVDFDGSIRIIEYYPHYDRRHNVNLVANYSLGDKQDWEINARWNFGTGFPFTLTQGYYPQISFEDGIYTDYTSTNEDLGILYADLNTGRLPTYHRLDVGLKKIFALGRYTKLEANLSVTNVYDRENIFYVDRVTGEKVYQLPIMPSIGVMFYF